ncbi:tumor necrosis factor ligand superfamily member 6 [Pholidichthys leucotaenia]
MHTSHSMAYSIGNDQSYPFPQVFLVDGGGGGPQHSPQPPNLIPCWSFPPAQERVRSRGKGRGSMGVSPCAALAMLFLFLLVFVALGFEAYKIVKIEEKLKEVPQDPPETQFNMPQKQIGLPPDRLTGPDQNQRPAAHVIGRVHKNAFHNTLRWEPKTGQAFTSGGVTYRIEDGALQVNESGIYHIYSRVELIFRHCSSTTSFDHLVFVRGEKPTSPVKLMEAHRAGFCSQQTGYAWTTESYLGSTQQLKKYDRVFVNVSHPKDLSHSHDGNFFGLYKI